MFEIGDTVKILPKEAGRHDSDYSYYYTDEMEAKYAKKFAKITKVTEGRGHKGKIPDDGKMYYLDIDNGNFQWASSMLQKKSSLFHRSKECVEEITEVLKPKPKEGEAKYKLNFNI